MNKREKMTFVTALTIGRAPLVLLFMVGALLNWNNPSLTLFLISFILLVGAAATDLFDGYFARKFNVETRFGAFADPLADKIFYLVSLPTLLFLICMENNIAERNVNAMLMLIFTVFFILRDQWVTFLRTIGSEYKADVRANWSGKARTALSFPIVCIVYLHVSGTALTGISIGKWIIYSLYGAGIIINMISIVVYTRQYLPYLKMSFNMDTTDTSG